MRQRTSRLHFSNETAPECTELVAFQSMQRKAINIIIHAVMDEPLHMIRFDVGNPFRMVMKLDERYESKSTATRISRMSELISLRHTSLRRNLESHIDEMAALLEQLESMNTKMPHELAIAFLISSIDVTERAPVTEEIKTLAGRNATWESVTARTIEEHMILKSNK